MARFGVYRNVTMHFLAIFQPLGNKAANIALQRAAMPQSFIKMVSRIMVVPCYQSNQECYLP